MYVDDVITGVNNKHEAITPIQQLKEILAKAGCSLHKLRSNVDEVLVDQTEGNSVEHVNFSNDNEDVMKTLGLKWCTTDDTFQFTIALPSIVQTKRHLLSAISKLFDPLGLVRPIIVKAE